MYIRLKFANFATLTVIICFVFLAYIIWGTEEHFPNVIVELRDLISYSLLAVELGGHAILDVNKGHKLGVSKKGETGEGKAELLTKADLLSNQLLLNILRRYPGLTIISEEKEEKLSDEDYEKYQSRQQELYADVKNIVDLFPSRKYPLSKIALWIDPLDATQEFTEGLLEYVSVMICITLDGVPIFGAIYRPFTGEKMYGLKDFGVVNGNGDKWIDTVLTNNSKIIIVSRSHAGTVKELASKFFPGEYTIESAGGSGYKSLRLLNGTAELYVHKTAIKKWDTCAGDALLRVVGGLMLDFDGDALTYEPNGEYVFRKGFIAAAQYPFTYFRRLRRHLTEV